MEIYLYTEPGCRACVDAKAFLTSHGISFQERNVRLNPEYLRILNDELNSCTTPTLVVDRESVVGFDRIKYQLLARTLGFAQPVGPGARPARRESFMKTKRIVIVLILLAVAVPLSAQMAFGPRLSNVSGVWNPVVGGGAAYEMKDSDGTTSQIEMTIIGKEDVQGTPGYWTEIAVTGSQNKDKDMVLKYLVTRGSAGMTASKVIMQQPGQDPMEMDLSAMGMGMGGRKSPMSAPTDIREKADLVGTETITVPAGSFSCDHYHNKDNTGDAWVSSKVGPWGLVKMVDKKQTMILNKVITDAKEHITGTPKPFNPMEMMRNHGGRE
jgi:glutaredoxin